MAAWGCVSPGAVDPPDADIWAFIAGSEKDYSIVGGSGGVTRLSDEEELWFVSLTEPLSVLGLAVDAAKPMTFCLEDNSFELPAATGDPVDAAGQKIPSIYQLKSGDWVEKPLRALDRCLLPIPLGQCWATDGSATAVADEGVACETGTSSATRLPTKPDAPCEPHSWVHEDYPNTPEGFLLCRPPEWLPRELNCGAGHRLPGNRCSVAARCVTEFVDIPALGRDVFQVRSSLELRQALLASSNALILLGPDSFELAAWPDSGSYELAGTCAAQTTLAVGASDVSGLDSLRLSLMTLEQQGAWRVSDGVVEMSDVTWSSDLQSPLPAEALVLNNTDFILNNSRVEVVPTAHMIVAYSSTASVSATSFVVQEGLLSVLTSSRSHTIVNDSHIDTRGYVNTKVVGIDARQPLSFGVHGLEVERARAALVVKNARGTPVRVTDVTVRAALSGDENEIVRGLLRFEETNDVLAERVFCSSALLGTLGAASDEACIQVVQGTAKARALGCGYIARCIEAGRSGEATVDQMWHHELFQGAAYIDKEIAGASIVVNDGYFRGAGGPDEVEPAGVRAGIMLRSLGTIAVNRAWIVPLRNPGVNTNQGTVLLADVLVEESNASGIEVAINGSLSGERVHLRNSRRGLLHTSGGDVRITDFTLEPGDRSLPESAVFTAAGGADTEIINFDIFGADHTTFNLASGDVTLAEGRFHGPDPGSSFNDTKVARSARGVRFITDPN